MRSGTRSKRGIVLATPGLGLMTTMTLAMPPTRAAPSASDLEGAKARLMELERDFQLVVERYNLVSEELASLQARIGLAEIAVGRVEDRMRTRRAAAIELATELYKNGRALEIEGILSARSLADLEKRVTYLQTSGAAHAQVFERLEVDRTELDKKIEQLDRDRAHAVAAQRQIDRLRIDIEAKVAEQRDEIDELRAAIAAAERREAEAARRAAAAAAASAARSSSAISAPARPAPAPNARAQVAVDAALSQLGKPYRWGAAGPDSYDCSGLTMWAWGRAGVALPHNSGAQYAGTARVDRSDLQPGDLLFFGTPIHHVGMYIGNGQMVEAPYTGSEVRVNSIARSDYVGAGRPGV